METATSATTAETATAKQRILEHAFMVAGRYGLEALTIGRLAGELNMSKGGVHGLFGSKQGLQLATIEWAGQRFRLDIIEPAESVPDGVPRLWRMCMALTAYSEETGLHGGDFWVTVAHEYDGRTGLVRDAIESTMRWWMRQLESVVAASAGLGQLVPCDPAQLAFEIQALFNAGGHMYRLHHDAQAPMRARTAILQRLEGLRGPSFPELSE
jgi:AcrR family transcriptional regulator